MSFLVCNMFYIRVKMLKTKENIHEKTNFGSVLVGSDFDIIGSQEVLKNPTIYYDPNTKGWDTCVWRDQFAFEAIN